MVNRLLYLRLFRETGFSLRIERAGANLDEERSVFEGI